MDARNEGLLEGINPFSYFSLRVTYENGCIHDSKSIGAFHEEVFIHDTRFRGT